jgi:formate hydrogenlyase transcriptional activator
MFLVLPVHVPPLRERPDAIPLPVRDCAQPFAGRRHNTIETIPAETMQAFIRYPWPGNIRDLRKIIERAVLLSPGPVWQMPLTDRKPPETSVSPKHHDILEEAERQHLLAALEETNGVLGGQHGAAIRLGMKRSTLQLRLGQLGISRPRPCMVSCPPSRASLQRCQPVDSAPAR